SLTISRYLLPPDRDAQIFPTILVKIWNKKFDGFIVLLHVCGLIYMFVALAIVCDEFFVPSLAVLTEKLSISDDVAGATFMAAGGSAPEFFTSVIGVFIAQNNVGIGTIVGSATFNILCVLACCTLFSKTVLQLTWWPLFRDVTIYIIALLMLVEFFMDEKITYLEALSLFTVYLLYCTIMKFNVGLEKWVKTTLLNTKLGEEEPESTTISTPMTIRINGNNVLELNIFILQFRRSSLNRRQSIPILHSGTMFRTGIMQLMHQTLDEVPEGEKVPVIRCSVENIHHIFQETDLTVPVQSERRISQIEEIKSLLEEEEDQPLNMEWPDKFIKQITYVCLAPVLIPMWVTIPDVRKPTSRKWYPVTFVISVLWIAFFSYLMVWWANTIGETLIIPTEVSGRAATPAMIETTSDFIPAGVHNFLGRNWIRHAFDFIKHRLEVIECISGLYNDSRWTTDV
ncbi:unnamed protein product, partial [Angiostrongylus costaricensis]|uniref:Na_Ca_ex domain-containing protein n=1 Tax=Angiostrongylus costaricensis TaxID=334426 RepID=A0A0R3PHL5_ANGCS